MKQLHKKIRLTALLLLLPTLLGCFAGCVKEPAEPASGTSKPTSEPTSGTSEPTSEPVTPKGVVDLTPAPLTPAEPIADGELPASGALKLKKEGAASIPADFFEKPMLVRDGAIAVLFDGSSSEKGIDAEGCEVSFTVKTQAGAVVAEGVSTTDTAKFPELVGENGLLGVSFDCDLAFEKFDKYKISLAFTDKNGAAYTLDDAELYYGLQYFGITPELFDFTAENIATKMGKSLITQTATIAGVEFTFVVNLAKWDGNTKPAQIITCTHLFWYCYPRMYFRFGEDVGSPTKVTLAFENEGYEIASTGGDFVHIHDKWLRDHKTDYDCLTHEFAHVIQNGWNGDYCEYSGYIERFADYCRYVYAYNNGNFNDTGWEMQTVDGEGTLETSVRFLAWLDYNYSTPEIDMIDRWFHACYDKHYRANNWDQAWAEITAGTPIEGKTGIELFQAFQKDEFAKLRTGAKRRGGTSEFEEKYGARAKLRDRLV